jgi:hypothetical protein
MRGSVQRASHDGRDSGAEAGRALQVASELEEMSCPFKPDAASLGAVKKGECLKMVLVVGATGLLGSEVCSRLREAGRPVKALVRPTADPARIAALRDAGVQLVRGDLKDGVSVEAACTGTDTVISTASAARAGRGAARATRHRIGSA